MEEEYSVDDLCHLYDQYIKEQEKTVSFFEVCRYIKLYYIDNFAIEVLPEILLEMKEKKDKQCFKDIKNSLKEGTDINSSKYPFHKEAIEKCRNLNEKFKNVEKKERDQVFLGGSFSLVSSPVKFAKMINKLVVDTEI